MKKRLFAYLLSALPLAILTWYLPMNTMLVVWGSASLAVILFEIRRSGRPELSALAITLFWLTGLSTYILYWAGVVFAGYGGEQLVYLQIGRSADWLAQDLQFFQHTMLPHWLQYGLIVLLSGPLCGAGPGWLLTRSGLLRQSLTQQVRR